MYTALPHIQNAVTLTGEYILLSSAHGNSPRRGIYYASRQVSC